MYLVIAKGPSLFVCHSFDDLESAQECYDSMNHESHTLHDSLHLAQVIK